MSISTSKEKSPLEKISECAIKTYNSKDTPEYNINFIKFVECLKIEYIKYLYDVYKYREDAVPDNDILNKITTSYMAVVGNIKVINRLIEKYDPEEGDFANYFTVTTKAEYYREQLAQERAERRMGIADIFSVSEQRYLNRIVRFMESQGSIDLSDEDLKSFCEQANLNYLKMREIWIKNRNSNVISINQMLSDSETDEINLLDEQAFKEYIDDLYCTTEADRFALLLKKLNEVYKNSFTNNHKKIFPPIFTSNYINVCVDDVKEKYNLKNRNVVLSTKWEDIRLEKRREKYAISIYLCISKFIFDSVIENRKLILKKDVANKLKFSEGYVSQEVAKIMSCIKSCINPRVDLYSHDEI